ncbi:hypothetical protein N015_16310 [Pseudomonas asturiensis]|uniref:Co-chaperone DjlA N-terminal domain-containing protein n=2 Tax=Pseudomonas syringae group TaxID=136849 RepID=A0ABX6HEB5_9PSED|nr:TerB family tellurite resistance protein [Pseudomonas asturiensis]QHF03890.1 hypothetical protein N015_16310 [Pseudomonas asturiensis]
MMFRRIYCHTAENFYSALCEQDASPDLFVRVGATHIFSSIGDALSRAYDAAKETVVEAGDKVADKISDAYDATVDTVSSAADIVSDAYSSTREVVSDVADKVADVAADAYAATSETISNVTESVTEAASDAYEASHDYVSDLATKLENEDGSLNYWAVAGGAVVGVAAVAAVPFTGGGSLLGAATLAGSLASGGAVAAAVGAGVAGAVIGVHLGDESAARERGFQKGYETGKAENAVVVQELRGKLEQVFTLLTDAGRFFDSVVAMHAVAISAANCDGVICDEEKESIELFISGLSAAEMPGSVIADIKSLYEKPPTLPEAFALAKESGIGMSVFDDIINLVVRSDGTVDSQEDAFMQAWNQSKTA